VIFLSETKDREQHSRDLVERCFTRAGLNGVWQIYVIVERDPDDRKPARQPTVASDVLCHPDDLARPFIPGQTVQLRAKQRENQERQEREQRQRRESQLSSYLADPTSGVMFSDGTIISLV
jgi:hypothetical protein